MNKTIIGVIVVAILGLGAYFIVNKSNDGVSVKNQEVVTNTIKEEVVAPVTEVKKVENKLETVIGKSAGGIDIKAYHYGTGEKEVLFVGGIHGGYEWNTVSLAYDVADYLKANPSIIPANLKVTVIPVLNPDGLNKVVAGANNPSVLKELADVPFAQTKLPDTVPGRFNANNVDLNRNFDCDWQTSGTWQNKTVSGGSAAFSEPESQAMKNYVENNKIAGAVVWYSAAGGVYSSNCHSGVLPETKTLTDIYAKASGYPAYSEFNYYDITGDMVNWLAKKNIPAISVLLTNHTDVEWNKNLAGIGAILKFYTK